MAGRPSGVLVDNRDAVRFVLSDVVCKTWSGFTRIVFIHHHIACIDRQGKARVVRFSKDDKKVLVPSPSSGIVQTWPDWESPCAKGEAAATRSNGKNSLNLL